MMLPVILTGQPGTRVKWDWMGATRSRGKLRSSRHEPGERSEEMETGRSCVLAGWPPDPPFPILIPPVVPSPGTWVALWLDFTNRR